MWRVRSEWININLYMCTWYLCFIMQRNQQRQCKQCGTVSLSVSVSVSVSVSISISSSKYIPFAHFSFFFFFFFVPFVLFFRLLILLLCVYFNEFHHQTLLSKLKLSDSVLFAPSVSLLLLISHEYCTRYDRIFFKRNLELHVAFKICRPWIWRVSRISRVIIVERVIN